MINPKTKAYISDHRFCTELLFKDWESFLDILYSEGGRVSAILWWDHCKKSEHQESVGSGGYTDPEDSEYIYLETQLYQEGLGAFTKDQVKDLIIREKTAGFRYDGGYISHDLVPSFYLAEE